jgi:ATP-dependent exoDNAse (exonuclease V) beta subunit
MSFTVYRSSAGSGKTYTLVKEYLKLILPVNEHNRYKNILAITFTNKAAAEMKERVITALTAISGKEKIEGTARFLVSDLVQELQMEESELRLKCGFVLSSMLHNYSDISIGTIDKFVHKIVRTFAYDLQIPVNFSVELDSENLLQMAIDLLIARVGSDEQLTQVLLAFTEQKAMDEKSWDVEQDLKNFASDLLKEQNVNFISQLKQFSLRDFYLIRETIDAYLNNLVASFANIGKKGLDLIHSKGIEMKDFAGGEQKGIGKYFTYLANGIKFAPTNYLQLLIENENWVAGKTKEVARKNIESIQADLLQIYNEAQKLLIQEQADYIELSAVKRNIYALSLLNEIEKVVDEIKKENNQVHISDFNKKIAAIVLNEPVPFLYERIGERYKNFLIDEFQDTSVLQWQNFVPLLENALASNEFNMVVGDAKQAIYRWRGGEVEQFANLPQIQNSESNPNVKAREDVLFRNYLAKELVHNRRSRREIVEFNNDFFQFVTTTEIFPKELLSIYDSLQQRFEPENLGGAVSFHFLNPDLNDVDVQQSFGDQVLKTIKNLLADNYQLSDIAILTRNNKNGTALASFLIEAGIPVVSKESLLLCASASVNFILNLLNFLNNSQHEIAKTGIIDFLIKRNKVKDVADLNCYFNDNIRLEDFLLQNFSAWKRVNLNQLPLYELCEEFIRVFELNSQADPYLVFFLDAVHSFLSTTARSVQEFMIWWERKKSKLSIVIPEGLNAVTVMTIHKSKGLEFPIVIFPYANWANKPGGDKIWVNLSNKKIPKLPVALLSLNKELEDTKYGDLYHSEQGKRTLDDVNILYVAFTRAVERLYVISEMPDKHKKIGNYYVDYINSKGLWQEKKQDYIFGEFVKRENKKIDSASLQLLSLSHIVSNDWRSKLTLSRQADKLWNYEKSNAEKDYGNLVHTALAQIHVIDDISKVLNGMFLEGLIVEEERNFLDKKLVKLLTRKDIAPFFQKGLNCKTEAEMILAHGRVQRPDRILFYPEKAVVLDYKTGVELEKHKTQILEYASTLTQMGYSKVEKYLLYTESEKLIEV